MPPGTLWLVGPLPVSPSNDSLGSCAGDCRLRTCTLTNSRLETTHPLHRDGDTVNRLLIQKLVRMFLALQTYKDTFEAPFMSRSREYYAKEGQGLLHKLQVHNLSCRHIPMDGLRAPRLPNVL